MRLMEMSKDSLQASSEGGERRIESVTDKIYQLVRDMGENAKTLKIADIRDRCTNKGYKPAQIDKCIEDYEELNVWQVNQAKTKITFVDV